VKHAVFSIPVHMRVCIINLLVHHSKALALENDGLDATETGNWTLMPMVLTWNYGPIQSVIVPDKHWMQDPSLVHVFVCFKLHHGLRLHKKLKWDLTENWWISSMKENLITVFQWDCMIVFCPYCSKTK
jgi:hypothetical protein